MRIIAMPHTGRSKAVLRLSFVACLLPLALGCKSTQRRDVAKVDAGVGSAYAQQTPSTPVHSRVPVTAPPGQMVASPVLTTPMNLAAAPTPAMVPQSAYPANVPANMAPQMAPGMVPQGTPMPMQPTANIIPVQQAPMAQGAPMMMPVQAPVAFGSPNTGSSFVPAGMMPGMAPGQMAVPVAPGFGMTPQGSPAIAVAASPISSGPIGAGAPMGFLSDTAIHGLQLQPGGFYPAGGPQGNPSPSVPSHPRPSAPGGLDSLPPPPESSFGAASGGNPSAPPVPKIGRNLVPEEPDVQPAGHVEEDPIYRADSRRGPGAFTPPPAPARNSVSPDRSGGSNSAPRFDNAPPAPAIGGGPADLTLPPAEEDTAQMAPLFAPPPPPAP